ncbi:phox (PX) domain-containing protein isoform X2 [Wolffia australiana]
MWTDRKTVREVADEAKKRVVLVLLCVFGISYLMSLTSSSVWVNLPAAACLIILLRYISLDLEVRKRSSFSNKSPPVSLERTTVNLPTVSVDKLSWRRKVDSPVVEAAINQLTRHLISEWVTDLWYSKITPDNDGPEELVLIMNNVWGEVSSRARDVNLINLLTRDVINLICNSLELYRSTQAKIGISKSGKVSSEHRDAQIILALASDKKLHPALVSAEDEYKVLQHLISGLLCLTFKAEDLNCAYFRYTVRELLACAVVRPLLNMANPRFINEKIESAVNSFSKITHDTSPGEDISSPGLSKTLVENSSGLPQSSKRGVELLQMKPNNSSALNDSRHHQYSNKETDIYLPKDSSKVDEGNAAQTEWGPMLDIISARRSRALAPEHFDNMWTRGRDYSGNEGVSNNKTKTMGKNNCKLNHSQEPHEGNGNTERISNSLSREIFEPKVNQADSELDSEDSYQTDDDDGNHVTGLDSPVTMVWDSKTKRNSDVSRIRHPLESFELSSSKRNGKSRSHHLKIARSHSGRKRLRTVGQKISTRIDVERASSLSDGRGDLKTLMKDSLSTGSAATSFYAENRRRSSNSGEISLMDDSFLKLKSEVLGANIVKSGWETFAVYSIAVTDAGNNSWSIKRRFRHFEELHRRLKEFSEYNLHLPPKHFLSSGLDIPVIHERCKLLDKYLKMLLGIPTLSGSIEVWDFLSVDSQTYIFSDSFSIVQTLSGDGEKIKEQITNMNLHLTRDQSKTKRNDYSVSEKVSNRNKTNPNAQPQLSDPSTSSQSTNGQPENLLSSTEAVTDPTLPIEWIPPNLSTPILDLVDVVFQLNDGGWIRRQVFWIAKQVLQLGMGDALDDWLMHKIQLLRTGSFVASIVYRIEQILWPDGIFLTRHPSRRRPTPAPSPMGGRGQRQNSLTDEQQREAARRAEFVHDLIIDKAPAALVRLIGRKEYEQCANDVYSFLQSSVFLKQLAFELLELLLVATFPELDQVVREIHQGKHLIPVS